MISNQIKAAISQHGPLTSAQMRLCVAVSQTAISRHLKLLCDAGEMHVTGYAARTNNSTGLSAPIYALDDKPCAVKPARRLMVQPQARPAPLRSAPQPAGIWSGLICSA